MVRRRVVVSGRVQGVGFRASCVGAAQRAGVRGWVRNLPDRRVEAVFEGEPDAVDTMLTWMRSGPPYAHVTHVEVHEEAPLGEVDFRVRAG